MASFIMIDPTEFTSKRGFDSPNISAADCRVYSGVMTYSVYRIGV